MSLWRGSTLTDRGRVRERAKDDEDCDEEDDERDQLRFRGSEQARLERLTG